MLKELLHHIKIVIPTNDTGQVKSAQKESSIFPSLPHWHVLYRVSEFFQTSLKSARKFWTMTPVTFDAALSPVSISCSIPANLRNITAHCLRLNQITESLGFNFLFHQKSPEPQLSLDSPVISICRVNIKVQLIPFHSFLMYLQFKLHTKWQNQEIQSSYTN